jgi:hypothetical protein
MKKQHKKPVSLEREVIISVTILYLLISGAVLAIHFLQPAERQTVTSSTSLSHSPAKGPDGQKQ